MDIPYLETPKQGEIASQMIQLQGIPVTKDTNFGIQDHEDIHNSQELSMQFMDSLWTGIWTRGIQNRFLIKDADFVQILSLPICLMGA